MARERVAQRAEVARTGAIGAHRMDAERVREPMPVRELAHALEVAGVDRRDDDLGDSCGSRPGDDGVAIGVELGGVEVAMRVDPHGARMADPRRRRRLRRATDEEGGAATCAPMTCGQRGRRCDRSWPACYRIDEGPRSEPARNLLVEPWRPSRPRMPPMKRVPLYSRSHRPTEPVVEPSRPRGDAPGAAPAAPAARSRWAARRAPRAAPLGAPPDLDGARVLVVEPGAARQAAADDGADRCGDAPVDRGEAARLAVLARLRRRSCRRSCASSA